MWLSGCRAAASCRSFWGRPSLARLRLLGSSPAGNSAGGGQLSSNIKPASPEGIKSLRRGLARQPRELFQFGLIHAVHPSPVARLVAQNGGGPTTSQP